jgi:uncharacterized hydantoinase/oxoprolinase family protein
MAYFIVAALSVKKEALDLGPGSSGKKFGSQLVALANLLRLHHGLMPNWKCKQNLPDAANQIVATRDRQQAGAPMDQSLAELRSNVEHLLDTIDEAFGEPSETHAQL